ncbi:methionine/alanine import family NSS transporter small subunit [Solicola gregarius]|uniref:Methionine/alanine import family NSS transporter small subunit n=1 Tax=Solicola gregarius TaxID=2908642 RepID=A0AA46TLT5_9ACTN|nr:methionine/alanine import family NSS transporter small subunit [Solicola gregarius]UYM07294.1 methionine/alanine import family NSS transporter small subunit [Solicola gregarius]
MSGSAIAMMIVAMLIIWGGLVAALVALNLSDRRRRGA